MPRKRDIERWYANEKARRKAKRNAEKFTVFRNGVRISDFEYPKEKAQQVFGDLLERDPSVKLQKLPYKTRPGHALMAPLNLGTPPKWKMYAGGKTK